MTVLVGRDTERDQLRAALVDAAGGAPRALAIRGDPGVGKTRLLDTVLADPVSDAFRVIRAEGHEAESEIPYAALRCCSARFSAASRPCPGRRPPPSKGR